MDKNRRTAYEVLLEVEKNQAYSNLALNKLIEKNNPENQPFVRELVYGVLKYKMQLDWYLEKFIPSGLKKVKKQDLTLMRMGVYQLKFMDSVPEYAAVNETVNMAKVLCRGRDKFINRVLREYIRNSHELKMPDAGEDPVEYLSLAYSVSKWIVELWYNVYGLEKAEEILKASNETPELSIRVNVLKTSQKELKDRLVAEGFDVNDSLISKRALRVKGSGILNSEAFVKGLFSVQDEASIAATDWLNPLKGEQVIDVCAAPGGKTFAMAELMENQGLITAMDIYPHKLELIEKTAEKLGISIVQTKCHDGTATLKELSLSADKVLVDAPCSGLGVIRRKPEIKYKNNLDLPELIRRQELILDSASEYVKPGGMLVYSTCTINPEENQLQVKKFVEKHRNFEIIEEKQFLPNEGTDGFFICKIVKG